MVSQNADDQAVVRAHMGDFVDSYVEQNFGAVNAPNISEPSATSVNVGREENIAGVQATFNTGREVIESQAPEPDISGKASFIKSSNTNVRENTSHALSERKDERDGAGPQKEAISKEAGKGVFEKTFTTSPDDLEAWTKVQPGSENQFDGRSNPGGERENPVQNRRRRRRRLLPKSDDDRCRLKAFIYENRYFVDDSRRCVIPRGNHYHIVGQGRVVCQVWHQKGSRVALCRHRH